MLLKTTSRSSLQISHDSFLSELEVDRIISSCNVTLAKVTSEQDEIKVQIQDYKSIQIANKNQIYNKKNNQKYLNQIQKKKNILKILNMIFSKNQYLEEIKKKLHWKQNCLQQCGNAQDVDSLKKKIKIRQVVLIILEIENTFLLDYAVKTNISLVVIDVEIFFMVVIKVYINLELYLYNYLFYKLNDLQNQFQLIQDKFMIKF
ncbi:unnamed protein product [Paramecium primaurelia]|uniref:Uncharacterized protein n=1 Tax=Paramecium primaurelia TaxID=5886 RepID=A0A8S1LAS3_PARPR|nr:unnamed protein product [Paramecium primaurelia]